MFLSFFINVILPVFRRSYSGALVCYILAEMRALRVLEQIERAHPTRPGAPLPDLRVMKRDLLPLSPKDRLPPLIGTASGSAAIQSLVAAYTKPKGLQTLGGLQ